MRPDTDFNGKDQAYARKNNGYTCNHGTVLGAIGLYEPLVQFAGAGASVPLTGFGNVLWKGMKMAVDNSGFLGLFKGGFTACAVGVSAALVFGYIASWIFEPKMKKK